MNEASESSQEFLSRFFYGLPPEHWNDWKWQMRNSISDKAGLEKIMGLSPSEEEALDGLKGRLPLRVTPYYLSLFYNKDHYDPLRRTMIPVADEFQISSGEKADPLSESHDSPVPGLVHRYPDRVLFTVTQICSAYCRYCTRSHNVARELDQGTRKQWADAIQYIRDNSHIRDVLISGGDPLTLGDDQIEYLLSSIRAIPHVEMIRIGTKVPVVLPMRITDKLTGILKKYHPLWMSIHFTHPSELTPETVRALAKLADAGIPLGSQTVLLKNINNKPETIKLLMHKLLMARVRPYYLYQCDPIPGSSHFRTKVREGINIIENLRGHTTGYAIPHFVIDAPGGGGKIPLLPEYVVKMDDEGVTLRNFENKEYHYYE